MPADVRPCPLWVKADIRRLLGPAPEQQVERLAEHLVNSLAEHLIRVRHHLATQLKPKRRILLRSAGRLRHAVQRNKRS